MSAPHPAVHVLVSEHCPHCARVLAELELVRRRHPQLAIAITDASDAAALRDRLHIQSVPATIIDGALVLLGYVTASRLTELVSVRGTPAFDTERLRALIERNRIEEAAGHLGADIPASAAVPLLVAQELSVRMGALVLVERAQEADARKVRGLAAHVMPLLGHDDARIRGDAAMLLGILGDRVAESGLRELLLDDDPDVVEAAVEALERMNPDQACGPQGNLAAGGGVDG